MSTTLNKTTSEWDVKVKTYFDSSADQVTGQLAVKLFTDLGSIVKIYDLDLLKNEDGEYIHSAVLTVPTVDISLWWPNGYGNASLYTLEATYASENLIEQDTRQIKIGFREISLNQDEIGK